ncbi:peptidoglycan-binding protein LysM [Marinilongibacter aquaticus]|uniref:peptidoglycan-binding protein LysM n=1 Tax=Marinilongibacter aquaticus TaxID=2975157 RepID=UPI0021BD8424|nr:peptidoglycan-binding protein LysM [Marinilongibacter aquaticus]UBM58456.1 peptidoglycan-binding protein LysM [Marinilongibacter aquaticus]
MGLLSFLKGVGEKILPSNEKEPEVKAAALLSHVQGLGLPFKKLTIKVLEDAVTLQGEVAEQVDAEKIAIAVGNVEGVASVDNQLVVAEPKPEAKFHTVEKGDFLSKIAKKYYGDANKYMVIFEANKPMLSDPDKIYPGQVLRIPEL